MHFFHQKKNKKIDFSPPIYNVIYWPFGGYLYLRNMFCDWYNLYIWRTTSDGRGRFPGCDLEGVVPGSYPHTHT